MRRRKSPAGATLEAVSSELRRHEITLQGGFVIVYRDHEAAGLVTFLQSNGRSGPLKTTRPVDNGVDGDACQRIAGGVRPASRPAGNLHPARVAQRNDGSIYSLGSADYTLATSRSMKRGGVVVVGLPRSARHRCLHAEAAHGLRHLHGALFRERRIIRTLYMVLLALTTALALFHAVCWLALYVNEAGERPS